VRKIKGPGNLRQTAAGESQFVKLQPGTASEKKKAGKGPRQDKGNVQNWGAEICFNKSE